MKAFSIIFFLSIFMLLITNVSFAKVTVPRQEVNYELPYPGLLPDNFLYPFKAFRDRLVSFFISDPQKKAEFDLLQADKRLSAGEYLLAENKKNDLLVSQTISKGENYFDNSIQNIKVAKNQGRLVNEVVDRLILSGIKHQQVLYQMFTKTHGQLHQSLQDDIVRMQNLEKEVKNLKLR